MRKSLFYLIFLPAGILHSPAAAQAAAEGGPEIVIADERVPVITVLGTGTPATIRTTGQPITVIDGDEIEQVQGADVTRVLERAPGLSFSRNGGPGAFTGVSLRGAASEQLLVLIDGVRVADPASPGGGFDFGTLLSAGIGKIEILRGSNGTIWGSQALGGVLAAWSDTGPGLRASAEYGARDTAYGTARAGIGHGPLDLSAGAAWYRTDGFSSAAAGTEPDGFRQWQAGGSGALDIAPGLRLRASLRYADSRADIDGFPAPDFTLTDTAEYQDTRQFSALGGLEYDDGGLQLSADWSGADTERDSFDPSLGRAPTFSTDGHSDRLDLRGAWKLGATTLWFGGENEWTRFATTSDSRQHARTSGAYLQLGHAFGALSLNVGARIADHSRFGGATTFGADASWQLGGGWRLRASFGEGFKAPTLFQLYSDFGNRALRPERSTSADIGIELNNRRATPYLAATLFRRDSEGLIDFVSCFGTTTGICADRPFGTYANVGRARAQGLELEAREEIVPGLVARAAWSFVDTEDRTAGSPNRGNRLARRPRQVLSLGGEWQVGDAGASLGADVRWSSASFDDAANSVRLARYAVLDLTARWPVDDTVELYGRVENLWNERYQTAAGYASPPRGLFVGARVRL
jgi:vitamin B12 transporter